MTGLMGERRQFCSAASFKAAVSKSRDNWPAIKHEWRRADWTRSHGFWVAATKKRTEQGSRADSQSKANDIVCFRRGWVTKALVEH